MSSITSLQFLAALTVLAGVILGLGRTPQDPAGTVNLNQAALEAALEGGFTARRPP